MQETLTPQTSPLSRLLNAITRLSSARRLTRPPEYPRDMVLTDQMEREFAAREARRWG